MVFRGRSVATVRSVLGPVDFDVQRGVSAGVPGAAAAIGRRHVHLLHPDQRRSLRWVSLSHSFLSFFLSFRLSFFRFVRPTGWTGAKRFFFLSYFSFLYFSFVGVGWGRPRFVETVGTTKHHVVVVAVVVVVVVVVDSVCTKNRRPEVGGGGARWRRGRGDILVIDMEPEQKRRIM